MSRYKYTSVLTSKEKKKQHYKTTIYNKVAERNDDQYFIAQEGDRCDNLAYKFYGDSELWWFIARVNNLKTNNIPAGTSIRIPVSIDQAKGF